MDITKNYKPKIGIIVYQNDDESFYLEKRTIIKKKNTGYEFGSAAPLKEKTIKRIANSLSKESKVQMSFKNVITDKVIHYKDYNDTFSLVWKLEASKRVLNFTKSLGITSGLANIPTLIFKVKGNEIRIMATKTKKTKGSTVLYKAPFHNISSNGLLCKGTGKFFKDTCYFEEVMEQVENGFFNSEFSHHNSNKVAKVNINLMWDSIIKKESLFSNDILLPAKKTLKQFIDE